MLSDPSECKKYELNIGNVCSVKSNYFGIININCDTTKADERVYFE